MAARRDLFNELPQETRLQIFRLATIKPSQAEDTRAEYRPFDAVALRDRDWSHSNQIALRVKATIVLVCKEWKALATEMLYECIRIRHGTRNLLSALESTRYSNPDLAGVKIEYDYGRWVRRIEISSEILDFDPLNPYTLLCIIQCCPFVQTIVRLFHGISLGPVRLPPGTLFPSIRRIDWWLSSIASQNSRTAAGGTYGFFGQLIAHSPGLDYLTLSGGDAGLLSQRISADPFGGTSGPFNSLTTLRLEGDGAESIIVPESMPPLPNFNRLVLGGVYASAKKVLQKYGHQIRVLEFVFTHSYAPFLDGRFDFDMGITDVLKACSNLEELNLPPRSLPPALSADKVPITGVPIHLNSLRSIRIQLDPSSRTGVGDFIRKDILCPVLERIVLYGGTRQAWEENSEFPILERYISENRILSLEFGQS